MTLCASCGTDHEPPVMGLSRLARAACPPTPKRECCDCHKSLPATGEFFHPSTSGRGLRKRCKVCDRARYRAKYAEKRAQERKACKPKPERPRLPAPVTPFRTAWRNEAHGYPA